MNKALPAILFFLLPAFLFSCGGNETDKRKEPKKETPEALKDDKSDLISSREYRTNDLVNELFYELAEKDPDLKKLVKDMADNAAIHITLEEKYHTYHDKSTYYYSSAQTKAGQIRDSLLRNKIQTLVKTSNDNYKGRNSFLSSLMESSNENKLTLGEYFSILKIVKTLPLIEAYQQNNSPDAKEFRDFEKEQQRLMERTDSLTGKY